MKKSYSIACITSIALIVISSILLFLPSFYTHHSKETMYIGGYGHSTSTGTTYNLPLFDASVFLGVMSIIFFVAALALLIVALILGNKRRGKYMLLLFFALVCVLVPGFATFFSQFSLGSSSVNGQAGAWHSTGEVVQYGAAGGWFLALCIGLLISVGAAITIASQNPPEEAPSISVNTTTKPIDEPLVKPEYNTETVTTGEATDLVKRKEELQELIRKERKKVKKPIIFIVLAGLCYLACVVLLTIGLIQLIDQTDSWLGLMIASGICLIMGIFFGVFILLILLKNKPINRVVNKYRRELRDIEGTLRLNNNNQ